MTSIHENRRKTHHSSPVLNPETFIASWHRYYFEFTNESPKWEKINARKTLRPFRIKRIKRIINKIQIIQGGRYESGCLHSRTRVAALQKGFEIAVLQTWQQTARETIKNTDGTERKSFQSQKMTFKKNLGVLYLLGNLRLRRNIKKRETFQAKFIKRVKSCV